MANLREQVDMPKATATPPATEPPAQAAYSALLEHCAGCGVCLAPEPPETLCVDAEQLSQAYRRARRQAREDAS
ncbi:hypothetical protein [Streptomyces sp. NPDC096311]|uniref:hypothetical protein n=1 Tax=Streptomyces sp. NPDC096311 TaxID=3366083 RepID=UPI0037F7C4DB